MISFPRRAKQNVHVRPCDLNLTGGLAMHDRLNRQDEASVWNVTRTIRAKDLAIHITVSRVDIIQWEQLQRKCFKLLKKVLRFLFYCAIF
jgi:hypothetical protein